MSNIEITRMDITKQITTNPAITPVDMQPYLDRDIMVTPFLDFLRMKGRIETADSYQVSFQTKTKSVGARFSDTETADDVIVTDPTWTSIPYNMSVIARRLGATDLSMMNNYTDIWNPTMDKAIPDIMTGIEEQIINPSKANITGSVDNVAGTASYIALQGTLSVTDLDACNDRIYQSTGYYPDFICCTPSAVRLFVASDPDRKKIIQPGPNDNFIGDYINYYITPNGPIPIITSRNFNMRDNNPGYNQTSFIMGYSGGCMMKFLNQGFVKELPTGGFDRKALVGAMVAFSMFDPDCFNMIGLENNPVVMLQPIDGSHFDITPSRIYDTQLLTQTDNPHWVISHD